LSPEQTPESVVIVDRRIKDVPIRRAMWPAPLYRYPVPERGVGDQPIEALARLVGLLTRLTREKRVIVLGAQPHTSVVALSVLVAGCGSITQAHELYAERGAAELPDNWDRFLTKYLLRFEMPFLLTGREPQS